MFYIMPPRSINLLFPNRSIACQSHMTCLTCRAVSTRARHVLSLQKGKPPKPGTKVVLRPRRQRGSQFLFESPNSDVINGQPYTDSTEPLKHHSAGDADTRNEEGNDKYPPGGSSHVGNFTYVVLTRCRIRSF